MLDALIATGAVWSLVGLTVAVFAVMVIGWAMLASLDVVDSVLMRALAVSVGCAIVFTFLSVWLFGAGDMV